MIKVYSKCYDEIGVFNDMWYIVGMFEKVVLFVFMLRDYKIVFFVVLLWLCNFILFEWYWVMLISFNDILY